jgi:AraC-like DNA-binding protein
MAKILHIRSVNDYARYIGAPVLHELVSVIHYDELTAMRHSLNSYEVYAMFLNDGELPELTYGTVQYTMPQHTLMCVSPGQIGGKTDTGEEIQTKGWALLFDPALLSGTELARHLPSYTYFSYNISEALLMSDEQRQIIVTLFEAIRTELKLADDDSHQCRILVHLIGLILEYIARFYEQQLSTKIKESDDLLLRFETLLHHYYDQQLYRQHGLPTVRYCAQKLFLSPNYFGDLIRQMTGDNASSAIRRFVMQRAQHLLTAGHTIAETAEMLGFDYPQHFTRMFKRHFGISPREYQKKR